MTQSIHHPSVDNSSEVIRGIAAQQIALYENEPRELISHFNREITALDAYRGRQILELLQNADDAGADVVHGSRVLFDVARDRLIIANTGTPFSHDGLMSLVISDCSPKQLEQNRFIGCKGLGFRAVLTWTARPFLSSGDLVVRFDKAHALAKVQELAAQNAPSDGVIERFHKSTGRWPAPVMRFPQSPRADDEHLAMAAELRSKGYDTVVVLPFDDGDRGARAFADAEQQLRELRTSSILFCRHLHELTIQGSVERQWSLLREPVDDNHYRVIIDDGECDRYWEVSRRSGTVSMQAAQEIEGGRQEFATAVAVPESWNDDASDNCLCVFFPTRESLPCPVILHATLETTEDRNRLVDHRANREVLHSLAHHLIDVIESQVSAADPLRALRMLSGIEDADPELVRLGFRDAVISACEARALLPRLNGTFGTVAETRRAPHDVWLRVVSPEQFPDVLDVSSTDGLSSLLKMFEIQWLERDTLKERLGTQLSGLEPREAGRIIGQLLSANQLRLIGVGGLLIDEAATFVDESQECFTNPVEFLPELPAWARDIRFLHADFQDGMLSTAGTSTLRSLVGLLEGNDGNVSEYRFDTVARTVIGKISDEDDSNSDDVRTKWRELYPWLLNASRSSRQGLHLLPIDTITVDGALVRATSCYLSDSYPRGHLTWRLYRPLGELAFAAAPHQLGLASTAASDVEQFLVDIGVRTSPKVVPVISSDPEYREFLDHVIDTLPYPLTVRGTLCDSAAKVRRFCIYSIDGLRAPEHFSRLLQEGDAAAVAAYLMSEGNAHLQNERTPGAEFHALIGNERKLWPDPSVPIPNLLLFWLQHQAWIPCADGKKHRPAEVMLSTVGLRVLQGVYARHLIDPNDPIVAQRGGRAALDPLLMRLGAAASLEAMGSEQVYTLLLGLPERDPAGEAASSIYRTLLEANINVEDGPERARFLREGRVWAKHRAEGQYIDYREVRYNANVTVPQVVESGIALLDLPRRRSAKTVEQIFGVKALASAEIQISVVANESEYDTESEDANAFLRRCIPFVYALRLGKKLDDDLRERNLLKSAHLYVCHHLTVDVSLPGSDTNRLVLNDPQDRIAIEANLYIIGQYDRSNAHATRFWQAVAGLVAEVLGTDVAAEVGAVLRCRNETEMQDVVEELLGAEAKAKLAEASNRFEDWFAKDDADDDLVTHLPPGEETLPPGSHDDGDGLANPDDGDGLLNPDDDGAAPDPVTEPTPTGDIGDKKFKETSGPEPRKRKRRKLIVRISEAGGSGAVKGPVATEEVTFPIVEAFERQDGDGRLVINVSHLSGSDAFGCDLISVRTEEQKRQILESKSVKDSDIDRFIEVKGRSSRTGEIELTENEYRAAERHRGRYYIYRVFVDPSDSDRFEIAVLRDPVHSAAVRTVTKFDLVQGSGADWYRVEDEDELEVATRGVVSDAAVC